MDIDYKDGRTDEQLIDEIIHKMWRWGENIISKPFVKNTFAAEY